jgi:glycerate-2-kinase
LRSFVRGTNKDTLTAVIDLCDVYRETLARCAPERLVRRVWTEAMPHNVVAIGKCAGGLLDGVKWESAFVAVPEGYPGPQWSAAAPGGASSRNAFAHESTAEGGGAPLTIAIGGHPQMTPVSFDAGRQLLAFVDTHDDILFLISGGGSACVEVALPPHSEEELIAANALLIASGKPIGEINAIRRELSAIKGGKLVRRVRGRAVTLVYSDVSAGRLADVASGPTLPGSEAILVADNHTLTETAAAIVEERGGRAVRWPGQIECDVAEAAGLLVAKAQQLRSGEVLVAGGEPTVVVRGEGRGGRCSELAVRVALLGGTGLFAGSDGVDGNSGAAGVLVRRPPGRRAAEEALRRSDTSSIATQVGEPIMIAPTGNNLRDLFLLARG